ncbi:hypothetical protein K2173_022983 [Erythroxylum novogranatense]|uniref:Uncharacterized protein n=1 Tax=Erythroxylum novogranatense TaxID=1862640 RepID=A0AAV8T9R4_9ROSI|nr:hypothetical protein K2173_022983 [Erythroxylum novogranatense]
MDPNSYTNNPEDFQFDYDYPIDVSQLMGDGDDPTNENFPSNQTVGRISNQQADGELGLSSCGSNLQALNQNLTEVIPGSCTPEMEGTPFLEPIQEDAPFVVQPDSSSFGSPVMEIPQRTLSTVQEHLETGNDDQALEEWLNNTNPDTTGIASITSSDTLVANPATNAPLDMGTPSVGAPSVTEATQPYVRAPELLGHFGNHVQVSNSSQVHLEPVVFPGTESQQSHRSISGQEPALTTNGGNIEQTMSTTQQCRILPATGVGRGAQHSNSLLLPQTSVPERPRPLLSALLADNRTQGMRSAYTPRTQQFINHDYQPSVLANSCSRQSQNTILPIPSLSQRPEFQLPMSNGIIDFQSYSPSSAISSATPRYIIFEL